MEETKKDIQSKFTKGNEFVEDKRIVSKAFGMYEKSPQEHYYYSSKHARQGKKFLKAIKKEITILQNCLPEGIFVRAFEDRMDLFSAMIQGPIDTPYEGGLFLFDIKLPENYPKSPPSIFYHSYLENETERRLNPNLYMNGEVCLSLLGTYEGPGWNPKISSLLQILVSIQGLILVEEPYFNESIHLGSKGDPASKAYNQRLLIQLFKSLSNIIKNPGSVFRNEIKQYLKLVSLKVGEKVERWANMSIFERIIYFLFPNQDGNCLPNYPILIPNKEFRADFGSTFDKFKLAMEKELDYEKQKSGGRRTDHGGETLAEIKLIQTLLPVDFEEYDCGNFGAKEADLQYRSCRVM